MERRTSKRQDVKYRVLRIGTYGEQRYDDAIRKSGEERRGADQHWSRWTATGDIPWPFSFNPAGADR